MNAALAEDPTIRNFLAQTRVALRGLPEREIDDILRELHSHIADLLQQGREIGPALESLGDPVDLAKNYKSQSQMTLAACSNSALSIYLGLRHAGRSRLGRFTATVLYAFAYINVVTLWLAAIEKIFAPSRTGLWYELGRLGSLRLLIGGDPPAGSTELLGWWLVPAAILVGWGIRYLADSTAQWWIRRYRNSKSQ
jgi:hypothetical protein